MWRARQKVRTTTGRDEEETTGYQLSPTELIEEARLRRFLGELIRTSIWPAGYALCEVTHQVAATLKDAAPNRLGSEVAKLIEGPKINPYYAVQSLYNGVSCIRLWRQCCLSQS